MRYLLTAKRPPLSPAKLLYRQRHTSSSDMVSTNGTPTSGTTGRKLKILMLHGFTQNGRLFEIKTKALKKTLEKQFPAAPKTGHLRDFPGGLELVYPTAPIRLDYRDVPGVEADEGDQQDAPEAYGWWRRKGDAEPYVYDGIETGLESIANVLRVDGPFDGVLGFSQGGATAGIVASLLESDRRAAFEVAEHRGGMKFPESFALDRNGNAVHQPLKFAVSYSGFGASAHPLYRAFYDPKIKTPMCHFLGTMDTVVSEDRSLRLVEACVDGKGKPDGVPRLIYHPGGHFLPSSHKQCVAALVAFIREALEDELSNTSRPGAAKEDELDDMDLPF